MKFGLPLFGVSPRFYGEIAQVAEANGFESVWMPEHLVFPRRFLPPISTASPATRPSRPTRRCSTCGWRWHTSRTRPRPSGWPRTSTSSRCATLSRWRAPSSSSIASPTVGSRRHRRRVARRRVRCGGPGLPRPGEAYRRHDPAASEVVERPSDRRAQRALRFRAGEVPAEAAERLIPIEVGGATKPALRRAGRLGDGWIEVGSRTLEDVKMKLDDSCAATGTKRGGRINPSR